MSPFYTFQNPITTLPTEHIRRPNILRLIPMSIGFAFSSGGRPDNGPNTIEKLKSKQTFVRSVVLRCTCRQVSDTPRRQSGLGDSSHLWIIAVCRFPSFLNLINLIPGVWRVAAQEGNQDNKQEKSRSESIAAWGVQFFSRTPISHLYVVSVALQRLENNSKVIFPCQGVRAFECGQERNGKIFTSIYIL